MQHVFANRITHCPFNMPRLFTGINSLLLSISLSISDTLLPAFVTLSCSVVSPLSTAITPSLFYSPLKTREVNKTFSSRPRPRPRLLFQDQDQDSRNFPRPRLRLFGQDQDQDQDLYIASDNLAKDN